MLGIIERELTRKYYFMIRPFQLSGRKSAFAKSEAAGTDLSGSWAESDTQKRDVNAYTDATNIHSFIDFHQSKGSHVYDVNGNVLLDLCSTESRPLGHNHEAFTSVSASCFLTEPSFCRKSQATVTLTSRSSTRTLTHLRDQVVT